ncbi:MAG: LysR substrate-binding domain-containing protein [Burkholderiaceae bacterium]|jgi:LysR family cys regulon transcriptional activator
MNLQQLRILRESARNQFNLTEVALALSTSQSGVSKAIKELEDELGIELFVRKGKRLLGFTEAGQAVAEHAEQALSAVDNMRAVTDRLADREEGRLVLATTHTQARYSLPEIVRSFRERYPKVQLALRQASPPEIADLLESGEADIGIATESLRKNARFVTFPFFKWFHGVVVPKGHALAAQVEAGDALTLATLAQWPLVTYHEGFTGRGMIDAKFASAGLKPQVVLEALDADVIKAYVELGLGVGLVASVAYDEDADHGLTLLDGSELFDENITVLALRRGRLLPGYAVHFAQLCVRGLTQEQLQQAVMEEA